MTGHVYRAYARFGAFLQENGVALFSGLGLLSAAGAVLFSVGSTVRSLRDDVQLERELRERDVQLSDAKRVAAVADARRETMQQLLQLGFAEEYQSYRQLKQNQNGGSERQK